MNRECFSSIVHEARGVAPHALRYASNGSKIWFMDARAKKISQTMRARRLDNFKQWRDKMKELGKIKSTYPTLKKDGNLAELVARGEITTETAYQYSLNPSSLEKLM